MAEVRRRIALFVIGYLKYMFVSQTFFIGLGLTVLPIVYLSYAYTGLSQFMIKSLELYGKIFSIDNRDEFANVTLILVSIIFPLLAYIFSKIFKFGFHEQKNAFKAKVLLTIYAVLFFINVVVIALFDESFTLLVPLLLLVIELVGYFMYLTSLGLGLILKRYQG
jgi:hypothetical protein